MTVGTEEQFAAITTRLAEVFARNLETADPRTPVYAQYAAGVGAVVEVQEFLRPTYDDPVNVDTEIDYLAPDMGQGRTFYLSGVTLREFLADSDVEVPEHELSWKLRKY